MVATPRDTELRHDGLTFRVTRTGPPSAEPLVLLHGFPGSRATWHDVARRLAASGLETVALEQRGYGPRARPPDVEDYALPSLCGDVIALLDHLDVDRCHLVGHDWGGIVGWRLAAVHPDRLITLTVLSTPHLRAFADAVTRPGPQVLRSLYALAFQVPLVPERLLTADGSRLLRTMLVGSGLDPATATTYARHLAEPDAMRAALAWYRAAFRSPAALRDIGPSRVPTTYVWSTHDVALGRRAAVRTGDHVAAPYRFVVLDGVAHWIPENEPARTADLVVEATRRR
jgi:pimeloyl-ACP methyl ester carboxylesterase